MCGKLSKVRKRKTIKYPDDSKNYNRVCIKCDQDFREIVKEVAFKLSILAEDEEMMLDDAERASIYGSDVFKQRWKLGL